MTEKVLRKIRDIIAEQEEASKEETSIDKEEKKVERIYNAAWILILQSFKNDYSGKCEEYYLPFIIFNGYNEEMRKKSESKNEDCEYVKRAKELLEADGFYYDETSNLLTYRIKRETILSLAKGKMVYEGHTTPSR